MGGIGVAEEAAGEGEVVLAVELFVVEVWLLGGGWTDLVVEEKREKEIEMNRHGCTVKCGLFGKGTLA